VLVTNSFTSILLSAHYDPCLGNCEGLALDDMGSSGDDANQSKKNEQFANGVWNKNNGLFFCEASKREA
jgi:hypothetical protein